MLSLVNFVVTSYKKLMSSTDTLTGATEDFSVSPWAEN